METICPNGHRLQVTADNVGTQVRCPTCQQLFLVSAEPGTPSRWTEPHGGSAAAAGEASSPADLRGSRLGSFSRFDRYLLDYLRPVGVPLLLLGLVLVLTARGCEALGDRNVSRTRQQAELAQAKWEDDRAGDRQDILDDMSDIREKEERTDSDREELAELQKRLDAHDKETEAERLRLQRGAWRKLEVDARTAPAENEVAGYWRELVFVIGTILLTIGLVAVAFTAVGVERWIALVILTIIIFSIYLGGISVSTGPGAL